MSSSGPTAQPARPGWPTAVVALALIYVAGLGSALLAPEGPVAAWYPAAGLGVSLLAISPRRRWLALTIGIAVVTAAAAITGGREPDLISAIAVGNAIEAITVASVLRRGASAMTRGLHSIDDLVRLLVAAVSGAIAVAVVALGSAALISDAGAITVARTVFTGHLTATLLIVPAALCLTGPRTRLQRMTETLLQASALVALTLAIFWPHQSLSLEFAPLPLLVWAALRLDLRVLTCEIVLVSGIVTFLTLHNGGPFGYDYDRGAVSSATSALLVQIFLISNALLTLPLAIAMSQRRGLLADLLASEQLTTATLDTSTVLIMVTDLEGTVVRVNHATTTLTEYAERDLVGRQIGDLPFAPPGATGYPAGLPESPEGQVSRETGALSRTGRRMRILWNTSYVRDEHGRPTYVVITGVDMTAERAAAGLNQRLLEAAITTVLIGIDPHGRITLFNAGAERLLGHDQQDMIGQPFVVLLDPAELRDRAGDEFANLVAEIGPDGASRARDWTWIGIDGRRHTVATTLSIAGDALSSQLGYLCVGRDVTEARASQEALVNALEKERLAVQRMREVDALKNDFVSTVSHELRTPVTSIVGYTEMLRDGTIVDPAPEQAPLLASIARNGHRLILLCNDLLTLSGLDAGAMDFQRAPLDLTSVAAGAEDAVRAQLSIRRLELAMRLSDQPVPVLGDREQLERVLTNLLSNAVKFTEDGGRVEVTVDTIDGEARLAVADTGIGIPAEEQDGLFERFFRSSSAKERAIQGTGLGLSIVAAIVAGHGGRIDVRSAHLEGTTFTVRLPLAR